MIVYYNCWRRYRVREKLTSGVRSESTKKKVHKYGLNIELNSDVRLIFLLNEQSKVIFNGRVFHEIVKGLVNTQLYLGINDKRFKEAIRDFVMEVKI
jgi:hypothetical protein